MKTVTFTLERDGEIIRVFSSIWGYCVWGTDIERVLASIVPLAQHLFYLNDCWCAVPRDFDPTSLLEGNPVEVVFETIPRLNQPKMLVDGDWWKTPKGKNIFFIMENGRVDKPSAERLFAQIRADGAVAE